jgi:hypothetical protein
MIRYLFTFVLATNFSCHSLSVNTGNSPQQADRPISSHSPQTVIDEEPNLVESFSDASKIARRGQNKIEIDILQKPGVDSASRPNQVAIVRFYAKDQSKTWVLRQTLEIESHSLADADPEIDDFNGDGMRDVTFRSNSAARGANEVRTLLIYDNENDLLVHIKNSEDYPNLQYNNTLNCIDSWMVHGASTTVFLRLDGDTLKEFASVSTGSERVVTVIQADGLERVVRTDKMAEADVYTRYRTFDPPKP